MIRSMMAGGCLAVLLGSCAGVDKHYVPIPTQETLMVRTRQFAELPVPSSMRLLNSKNESWSFKTGSFKWAELQYRGDMDMAGALEFLRTQLAQFEWQLVKDEVTGPKEHFLEGVRGCYVAKFSLTQRGRMLQMKIQMDTDLLADS